MPFTYLAALLAVVILLAAGTVFVATSLATPAALPVLIAVGLALACALRLWLHRAK